MHVENRRVYRSESVFVEGGKGERRANLVAVVNENPVAHRWGVEVHLPAQHTYSKAELIELIAWLQEVAEMESALPPRTVRD